ncbi:MAG TPA: GNAT family N-acetyltransferase [Rhodobacteraceae bacterium]|nr:GNAT family N-acetyltransferase [Paracoccaceae bacterium]
MQERHVFGVGRRDLEIRAGRSQKRAQIVGAGDIHRGLRRPDDEDALEVRQRLAERFDLAPVEAFGGDERFRRADDQALSDRLEVEGGKQRAEDAPGLQRSEGGDIEFRDAAREREDAVARTDPAGAENVGEAVGLGPQIGVAQIADRPAFRDPADGRRPGERAIAMPVHRLVGDIQLSAARQPVELRPCRAPVRAARVSARSKPVIVVKARRHPACARAAASHTGAMAGSDPVYETAIRRAGMLRGVQPRGAVRRRRNADTGILPKDDRIAIVTDGGGIGVLATDPVVDAGGRLAELGADTLAQLDAALPPTWSRANPVDIIGDATGARYADTMKAICEDPNTDAVLVLNCPTAIASQSEAATAVAGAVAKRQRVSVLTSWVGNHQAEDARRIFTENGIPTYETPTQAVRAFMHLLTCRRNQQMLTDTVPSVPEAFTPDRDAARAVIAMALAAGRDRLSEPEAKRVLAAYDIPVPTTRVAKDPTGAAQAAAEIGSAVLLKILSPDLTHKSDFGGVALDLAGSREVRDAAAAMRARVREHAPQARIDGFQVQPMIQRPDAFELIVGVTEDAPFGPMLLIGQGGTDTEIIGDRALALPPLNMRLAREAIERTRISRLLAGYRDRPAANLDAIALTLVKVSQMDVDFAEIKERDINPLLADTFGVIALDARIRVGKAGRAPEERLAIRPYPKELEEDIRLGDGRTLLPRPIRPEDEPQLKAGFAKLSEEEIRLRFFVTMKTLSHVQAARLSQIDYDREMALILTEPGTPGTKEIFGVVRMSCDPDNENAEFAIVIRREMTGLGLGVLVMRRIIDYARRRGTGVLFGDVLKENTAMLKLCGVFGCERFRLPEDSGQVRVTLKL